MILILIIVLLIIFRFWFMPGPRVAVDFPIVSENFLKTLVSPPFIWATRDVEGLGEYIVFTLWSWPYNFITGILASLGINFALQERIIIVAVILISFLGIFKLCQEINISQVAKLLAGFFYATTTYLLLLIDGGQLSIAFCYALLPFVFWLINISINGDLRKKVLASLGVLLIGIFDIRFTFLIVILCLLRFLYGFWILKNYQWLSWIFNWIKLGLIVGIVMLALNFYWILPLLLVPVSGETYAMLTQKYSQFVNLGHSLLLLSPHWFKNVFGEISPIRAEFIFLPILVFLAPILRPKDKTVGFWLIIALFSIFLTKGETAPLANVYRWLFENITGFSLFRDSTKFFVLTALSYSILLAITFDELVKRFKYITKIKTILSVGIVIYLFFLIRPIWSGQMTGTFSKPVFEVEYKKLASLFEDDKQFSRIFWIPTKPPLGYFSFNHPSLEASRLVQKRPFSGGTVGTYEAFNFLREAPYMGELFDISGVKYLIYPYPDPRRKPLSDDEEKYYQLFLNQLSQLPWVESVSTQSGIPLLKTKNHQERFFIPQRHFFVVGSDALYNDLMEIANFRLASNGITFLEEKLSNFTEKNDNSLFILFDKNKIDLAASFIDKDNLVFPASELEVDPNKTGWWMRSGSQLIDWRSFLQQKYSIDNKDFDYGGGWAVAEGDLELNIRHQSFNNGRILLARVMESTKSGSIKFYQEEQLLGTLETKKNLPVISKVKLTGFEEIADQEFIYEKGNFSWHEVGSLKSDEPLTLRTQGQINVVNAIASVDANLWNQYRKRVEELDSKGQIYKWNNLNQEQKAAVFKSNNDGLVSYKQINPTHYQIVIKNLKSPTILAFSETYHSGWQLGNQTAIPLYGLINGFEISQDGVYDIYFAPQKYINIGFIVSIIAGGLILLYLFLSRSN